MAKLLT